MSALKFDFHTVCSDCRGVECDLKTRCIECTDVDDSQMKDYVSHKLGLQRWLLAKCKHKTCSQTSKVIVEPEVFDGDAPAAIMAPSVSTVVPTASASDSAPMIVDQVKLMLDSFKDSMEARFVSIDNMFSQFSASTASPVSISNVSCQDAPNISFSAPSPVTMCSEHQPDRGPCAPYSDGLGSSLGGSATVSTSGDTTSLPHMAFAELLETI